MSSKIIKKPKITYTLICCCTYKREKQLARLLENLKHINYPNDIKTAILIIDNDVEKSAQKVANKTNVLYVVEPKCSFFQKILSSKCQGTKRYIRIFGLKFVTNRFINIFRNLSY